MDPNTSLVMYHQLLEGIVKRIKEEVVRGWHHLEANDGDLYGKYSNCLHSHNALAEKIEELMRFHAGDFETASELITDYEDELIDRTLTEVFDMLDEETEAMDRLVKAHYTAARELRAMTRALTTLEVIK